MDPLSVQGSLATVTQLSQKVIPLLDVIKAKSKAHSRLMVEISSTVGLFRSLNQLLLERRDEAQWPKIFVSLLSVNGPIDDLVKVLEGLVVTLSYRQAKSLFVAWRFMKLDVDSTLRTICHVQNLLGLAMQEEHS